MVENKAINLTIKSIDFNKFKEYLENGLIEKLNQKGILFIKDKYNVKLKTKIPRLDKLIDKVIDPFESGKGYRGGSININDNEIQCHLSTYKKLGLLGKIAYSIDLYPREYRINILITATKTGPSNDEIKLVIGSDEIKRKKFTKSVYITIGIALVLLAIVGVLFPPIFIISLFLTLIFAIIFLPILIISPIMQMRIIRKGMDQLIKSIQEVIKSDFTTV
ncbi:MAG: hypothetical protein L6265_05175 [Thermoplasmatales archaeon]|nr:hypothetical protein [Euryarchaeota archaeon]MCG2738275.1 hypothetical protein [Candidatus Methanoperedenaceae archaeon]MCG2825967.1 hypothetical protein [Thermoplasmatales archaeon]